MKNQDLRSRKHEMDAGILQGWTLETPSTLPFSDCRTYLQLKHREQKYYNSLKDNDSNNRTTIHVGAEHGYARLAYISSGGLGMIHHAPYCPK